MSGGSWFGGSLLIVSIASIALSSSVILTGCEYKETEATSSSDGKSQMSLNKKQSAAFQKLSPEAQAAVSAKIEEINQALNQPGSPMQFTAADIDVLAQSGVLTAEDQALLREFLTQ